MGNFNLVITVETSKTFVHIYTLNSMFHGLTTSH